MRGLMGGQGVMVASHSMGIRAGMGYEAFWIGVCLIGKEGAMGSGHSGYKDLG